MRHRLSIAILALLLSGCGSESPPQTEFKVARSQRFAVEEVGEFYDGSHDGGYRRMFLVRDSKTGVEFLAISGVGVTKVDDDTAEAVAAGVAAGVTSVSNE